MTPDIDSPTGLDMNPRPPEAVRVRKSIGLAILLFLGLVAMLIVFGVYQRQHRQLRASDVEDVKSKATPATASGRQIVSQIPPSPAAVLTNGAPVGNETDRVLDDIPTTSVQTITGTPQRRSVAAPTEGFPYQNAAYQRQIGEFDLATQREREAIEAPTRVAGGGGVYGNNTGPAGNPASLNNTSPFMFNGSGAGVPGFSVSDSKVGSAGMSQTGEYNAQNSQDEKIGFIAQARNRAPDNYLRSVRVAPLSKFEIKAGWDIHATLEQAINSDQPGEIRALVRENVYDTATGRYVLVPQGSRLIGSYNSAISYGQDGVQAVWDRIIFPDASSLNLGGMIGEDAAGQAGLRYAVDHHYARLLGFAVMTSLFSAGFQLSQNRPGSILTTPSTGEIIGGAVGGQISQLGAETFRRQENVQPTIRVPAGYRFNVRVNKDIVFDSPYSPHH